MRGDDAMRKGWPHVVKGMLRRRSLERANAAYCNRLLNINHVRGRTITTKNNVHV